MLLKKIVNEGVTIAPIRAKNKSRYNSGVKHMNACMLHVVAAIDMVTREIPTPF